MSAKLSLRCVIPERNRTRANFMLLKAGFNWRTAINLVVVSSLFVTICPAQPNVNVIDQASKTHKMVFDVVSIKPSQGKGFADPIETKFGSIEVSLKNINLRFLIQYAFELKSFQIVGGPKWIVEDHYDIVAKSETAMSSQELHLKLQSLLADRFNLTVHREGKDLPIYALSVDKVGAKFQSSKKDQFSISVRSNTNGQRRLIGEKSSMLALSDYLSTLVDRPVLDHTGITGDFDFTFEWDAHNSPSGGIQIASPQISRDTSTAPEGPSIFTAIREQLGLKLDATRGTVDVLIVDGADRPSRD
jgi:uncharacterized protein (TIGR03435 family)